MSWAHTALGQVCTIIMGQSPPGSTYNETGQGLPFFQGSKDFGTRYPSERVYCTAPTRIAEAGDILFSVRAPIGSVNRANQKCAIGRGLSVIRSNTESDTDFVEFLLRSMHLSWSTYDSQGAIFGNARKRDLEELEIVWPPNHMRARIASILSAYDDLIENNQRRIQLLEQSAQLLYKEWFVHLRFPRHEHVAITDGVPEGWMRKPLGENAPLNYGKALKKDDRIPGPFPVFGSSGIIGTHEKSLVFGPAIIVGRKGNVGSTYWSQDDFYPIDTVYFIEAKYCSIYLYHALLNTQFINTDVAVPGLNRDFAHSRLLLVPDNKILALFEQHATEIYEQINRLTKYNQTLTQARDLLLPRLMNGEISV